MSLVPTRKEAPQIIRTPRRTTPPAGVRTTGSSGSGSSGSGITPKDIFRMLRRRKWLIIFSVFLFTVASIVSTLLWLKYAPLYTAKAFLKVNPPKTSDMRAAGRMGNDTEMERLMMNQIQATVSAKVIDEACKSVYHTRWYNDVRTEGNDPTQVLMDEIKVSIIPKTSLISISMTGQDKKEIAEIANAVAEAAVDDAKNDAGVAHSEAISRIQFELKDFEKKRKDNDDTIKMLESRNMEAVESHETLLMNQKTMVDKYSQLSEEFKAINSAWEDIKSVTDEELAQQAEVQQMVSSNTDVQQLRNRVLGLKLDLDSMKKRFGPNHKSVIRTETSLASAQSMLAQKEAEITQRSVQQLKSFRENQVQEKEKALVELGKRMLAGDAKIKTWNDQEKNLKEAKEKRDKAEAKIMSMNDRIMDFRLMLRGEQPLVFFRRAMEPEKPSQPKFMIMVPAGLMLGLFLGVGLAFLLELLDTSIKAPSDVSRRVDLPLLGMIPHLDDVEEDIADMRLAFLTNPKTLISESFRQIRTTLMFSGTAEQRRSILVSSAMPEDGRTTVALNLAHAIASGGKRVLVVDANFRQPMFRTLFPECPDGGLSTALVGQADWRNLVHQIEPRLDIMASGPHPPNPADLLGSSQMQIQIEEFYQDYDQVIFDSSPCLVVSDAVTLSTMVEGAILVVRAGVNTYGIVQRARDMITRLGTPIFGVVLNGVRVTAGGYLRKNYETFYEYREQPKLTAPEVAEVVADVSEEKE